MGKCAVERMRRKQRLHEGDRSDVVLQMLDDATQGFTYDGWERDAKSQESQWVFSSSPAAGIESAVERMCRKQRLHEGDRSDVVLQMLDDATQGSRTTGGSV